MGTTVLRTMGACYSPSTHAALILHAIKKEKKIIMLSLEPSFEQDFIDELQSVLCMDDHKDSFIHSQYNFGALTIHESTPEDLPFNNMANVNGETFAKLNKYWKVIDYDLLLRGYFRLNYEQQIPNDIIKFMKSFYCIPSVDINAYKMRGIDGSKSVMNLMNISPIYRRCWSMHDNKHCFRHRELSYAFQRVKMSMFLVDLSAYDRICDRTGVNMMKRAVKLYQWFLKDWSLYLKKNGIKSGNMLLIFENVEAFKHKLSNGEGIRQCCSFSKYIGTNDYDECREYIMYRFGLLNLYSNIKMQMYFDDESNVEYLTRISNA